MKKLLIISILLSPFCILFYSQPYQNGRQESGRQVISSGTLNGSKFSQNYPNPFNLTTTIKWPIPKVGIVTSKIYDVLGREVTTLVTEEIIRRRKGEQETIVDASIFSRGVYFY